MAYLQPYNQSVQEILRKYESSEEGLNEAQIKNRLQTYGLNQLKQKKKINPIAIFLSQFKSFIIYILLFAIIIAALAKEYIDASVIFSILILNAFLGFVQEYKAEKALEALKNLASLKAKVIRSGKTTLIDTKEIVPGDIILVEEGSRIPADARIIESYTLYALESALTGESMPVEKFPDSLKNTIPLAERKNMIYSGTIITRGKAKALVIATGMQTEIGKIANLISDVEKDTLPLQKKLETLGRWLGLGTILISLIIFLLGVTNSNLIPILLSGNIIEFLFRSKIWLLTAIALAVAAVPEGLPAIVTITLALGTRRMLKKNVLIRKLGSVETLGDTTTICTDKTGTLTKNEMTVRKAFVNNKEIEITGAGYNFAGILSQKITEKEQVLFKIGALCNNASLEEKEKINIVGDPTEAALLISAKKAGVSYKELQKYWKRLNEMPFDSDRKMMSTINKDPKTNKTYMFSKGAPEVLLKKCTKILINGKPLSLTQKIKKDILAKNDKLASQALRVLGFAYKESLLKDKENNLIFVGLQGMLDPPHDNVKDSIKKCKEAGIRVIMITGDNKNTAESIAREIEITGNSINGAEFAALSKAQQLKILENTNIFARVEPEHKMIIVKLLQKNGEIVAMTGDGVNDAPAIKKADIGISMGLTGTDVTKETSDMILQDDNFSSIVSAVEEGRGIRENIKKFVNYLLSSNIAEILIIFFAMLLSWPLPMTAVMILWLNLVTDGLPALALGIDSNPQYLMKISPKKKSQILDKSLTTGILLTSILITIGILSIFYIAMIKYANLEQSLFTAKIQTIAFTALIIMELVRLEAIRSGYKLSIFSNKYLVLAIASSIILQLILVYSPLGKFFGTTPLTLNDWALILGITLIVFVINILAIKIKNKLSTKPQ